MKRLILLFFISSIFLNAQDQIGSTLFSEFNGEQIFSMDISSQGNHMVVGSINDDSDFPNNGYVRVYERQGNSWIQVGTAIEGIFEFDQFGYSTAISADGTVIAVGAPYQSVGGSFEVWRWQNDQWNFVTGLESMINSEITGFSIDISNDGSVVSVGYPGNTENGDNAGKVRVWQIQGNSLSQLGSDINGEPGVFNFLGYSLSLSGDGNRILLGTPNNNEGGSNAGKARVYELVNNSWNLLGAPFNGQQGDVMGFRVNISNDGNRIAFNVGSTVEVYEYSNNQWVQIGNAIDNAVSVALSNDVNKLAVANQSDDADGEELGSVRMVELVNDTWQTSGSIITGDNNQDRLGFNISLSSDANTLGAFSVSYESNGTGTGYVKAFDVSNVLSNDEFTTPNYSLFPNPAQDYFYVNLTDENQLEKVELFNNLGQLVMSTNNSKLDISNLESGLYLVKVHTGSNELIKKLIVKK